MSRLKAVLENADSFAHWSAARGETVFHMRELDRWRKPTWVYAVGEDGTEYVKIGLTQDPQKRLRALRAGNPRQLTLLHTVELGGLRSARRLEAAMLERLPRARGEWVSCPHAQILALIAKTLADLGIRSNLLC